MKRIMLFLFNHERQVPADDTMTRQSMQAAHLLLLLLYLPTQSAASDTTFPPKGRSFASQGLRALQADMLPSFLIAQTRFPV